MKRLRRKNQSKMYAIDIQEIDDAATVNPVMSISGGRDFYLTEIIIWTNKKDIDTEDVRITFEDNTTDMQWQDKAVNIETFVNNQRRLSFQRDLAHKTDVSMKITNNSGVVLKVQVIFLGYEMRIRPEGDKLTS